MQLSANQLRTHLKETLYRCYLLHGNEWLLAEEAQSTIEAVAKQRGFSTKKIFYIQQESDWQCLKEDNENLDLFAHKQIFLIRCFSPTISKSAQALLQQHLNAPSPNQIWIIITPRIKSIDQKKNWYQLLLKKSVIVPIYELKGIALQKWVKNKLELAKINITHAPINQLITLTQGNIVALDQAIQKLKLLFSTKPLTLKDINFAIYDHAQFNLFSLIDELLNGQTQKAQRILQYLFEVNHSPLLILWGIARQLRELITLSKKLSSGTSMQKLLQSQWVSKRACLKAALLKLSLQTLEQLLLFCAKIDKMLKNGMLAEGKKALEVLVIRFNHPKFLKR